ncbi:MAG: response regulator transcription factor [Chloroflexi bacterium]|nr:response regulator transcription factor [Chloroflexota bacterium]
MARRVIRRRPSGGRVVRRVVRGNTREASQQPAATPPEPAGITVLMATSNLVRNLILPKLAAISGIRLVGLADSPDTALKMLMQEHPEAVIFDMDFGGELIGLDTARMMQKTRIRAAVVMMVPELDVDVLKPHSRRFGTSWSYVKKSTAARVDVLEVVIKSAIRGVQWIEPDLSRPLSTIWKVADQARDLEAAKAVAEPVFAISPTKLKNAKFEDPESPVIESNASAEDDEIYDDDEIAPGIKTQSTRDAEVDGLNITSVSVGHGGIGQNVGKVRRAG